MSDIWHSDHPADRAYRRYRRKQWRESKRYTRAMPVGWLHAIACPGGRHRRRKSCQPIPVWDPRVVE